MTDADALRVVAMLTAYFRQELSEETAVLWATELREFEAIDGQEAARVIGRHNRFMPSLVELVNEIMVCRFERVRRDTPALPPPTDAISWPDFLKENPELRQHARTKMGWFKDALDEEASV